MALDLSSDVVIRWDDLDPKHIPLLKQCGATAVLPPRVDAAFAEACRQAGLKTADPADIPLLGVEEMNKEAAKPAALRAGLWPGISRGGARGRDDEVSSASRQPWIDANGFWIGYLRAMYPKRPAVLGYLPNEEAGLKPDRVVPHDSLELALIEAWANGGNFLLAAEPRFRKALLEGDEKAGTAWAQLGRTAAWLREHRALFGQPVLPMATALVEDEITAELANLMYRQNVSPRLASAAAPPPPNPHCLALVAASISDPAPEARRKLLAHTEAGCSLVVDAPGEKAWWRAPELKHVRAQEDRDFFSLGRGQVIAYREQVADPSEFALDVIDIVTQKQRAVRLWNAHSVIALATAGPKAGPAPGAAALCAINYGVPVDMDFPARIQEHYAKATLLRPEAAPVALKAVKRGTTTEVYVPELRRLGVIVFS